MIHMQFNRCYHSFSFLRSSENWNCGATIAWTTYVVDRILWSFSRVIDEDQLSFDPLFWTVRPVLANGFHAMLKSEPTDRFDEIWPLAFELCLLSLTMAWCILQLPQYSCVTVICLSMLATTNDLSKSLPQRSAIFCDHDIIHPTSFGVRIYIFIQG